MKDTIHIAFFTNEQQTVLKYLLENLFALQIKLGLQRVSEGKNDTEQSNILMKHLEHFHEITYTIYSVKKAEKGNAFYLSESAITQLKAAMDCYDRKASIFNEYEQTYISRHFDKLKTLVDQSAEFEYTMDEIKKASG